jgi:WD40 repeat protein
MNTSSATTGPGTVHKYKGFISYSHAADGRLAPTLQSGLQRFAKPWYRLRSMRVFRDKTGLAVTPELWGSIQKALADSDYFLLLASPQAAQSKWVEQEVDWWLRNRSAGHLLIVWTDGELTWDPAAGDFDWTKTTALPHRLQKVFQEEPNHLDLRFAKTSTDLSLRQPKFLEAIAGLSATLKGRSLDDLIGEDVVRHQKTIRLLRFAVAVLVMLTLTAGIAAYLAMQARKTAGGLAKARDEAVNQQQREAMSREAADRSLALLETNRELAILLAAEAVTVYPTAKAESALRQSLFETLPPKLALPGHAGLTNFARFTLDGRRVITGGEDKVARLWESDSGKMALELRGHTGDVAGADVAPTGNRICTSSRDDHTARVWDAANGKSLVEINQQWLAFAVFSPDGKQILTVADQRDAVLWDAESGQRLRQLDSPYTQLRGPATVISAHFSPDGNRVALVDFEPVVCDVATGKILFTLKGHHTERAQLERPTARDIGYSPNGEWLVTASSDHTARIWRAATGKSMAVLPHDAVVLGAEFSPGGQWIVTVTAGDGVVRVWDAASREKVSEIDVRPKRLGRWALSRDGKFLVTALAEDTAEVFETSTGARVAELIGHTGRVLSPSFSPDGQSIVTAGLDGKVNLYAFKLGGTTTQLLELAHKRVPRPLSPQERAQHLPASFRQHTPIRP